MKHVHDNVSLKLDQIGLDLIKQDNMLFVGNEISTSKPVNIGVSRPDVHFT